MESRCGGARHIWEEQRATQGPRTNEREAILRFLHDFNSVDPGAANSAPPADRYPRSSPAAGRAGACGQPGGVSNLSRFGQAWQPPVSAAAPTSTVPRPGAVPRWWSTMSPELSGGFAGRSSGAEILPTPHHRAPLKPSLAAAAFLVVCGLIGGAIGLGGLTGHPHAAQPSHGLVGTVIHQVGGVALTTVPARFTVGQDVRH